MKTDFIMGLITLLLVGIMIFTNANADTPFWVFLLGIACVVIIGIGLFVLHAKQRRDEDKEKKEQEARDKKKNDDERARREEDVRERIAMRVLLDKGQRVSCPNCGTKIFKSEIVYAGDVLPSGESTPLGCDYCVNGKKDDVTLPTSRDDE